MKNDAIHGYTAEPPSIGEMIEAMAIARSPLCALERPRSHKTIGVFVLYSSDYEDFKEFLVDAIKKHGIEAAPTGHMLDIKIGEPRGVGLVMDWLEAEGADMGGVDTGIEGFNPRGQPIKMLASAFVGPKAQIVIDWLKKEGVIPE